MGNRRSSDDIIVLLQMLVFYASNLEKQTQPLRGGSVTATDQPGCSSKINPDKRQLLASRTHDLLHSSEPDEKYYSNLLAEIHTGCGDLCTNDKERRVKLDGVSDADLPFATYFSYRVVADVNCCDLFAHPLLDAPAVRWPPPKDIRNEGGIPRLYQRAGRRTEERVLYGALLGWESSHPTVDGGIDRKDEETKRGG